MAERRGAEAGSQPAPTASSLRAALRRARRVVVKIGSRTLADDDDVYDRLAAAVVAARHEGRSLVLVSSGAIALGTAKLGFRGRPREMARLQAAAAAGQSVLMHAYENAFASRGVAVAQVLLTHADLADRVRSNNARAALGALLDAGAVPILNENDSVAVDEIKFGDNDQLAAMVAPMVDADLLVLLSDVEGLLDADGKRVPIVRDVKKDALPLVRRPQETRASARVGTGGMASKLEAARRATLAGAHAVVADARAHGILEAVLRGDDVGTLFLPSADRLSAKKHWIAFTLRPKGVIVLDAGASAAVRSKGRSVLPVGVLGVRGDFRAGEAVRILDASGEEIGRGLARCAAGVAARVAGKAREELSEDESELEVVVHRDEMAVWR
jgi:glutamate 5-kinase